MNRSSLCFSKKFTTVFPVALTYGLPLGLSSFVNTLSALCVSSFSPPSHRTRVSLILSACLYSLSLWISSSFEMVDTGNSRERLSSSICRQVKMLFTLPWARANASITWRLSLSTDTKLSPGRHSWVRNLSISLITNVERNSGFTDDVGDRTRGLKDPNACFDWASMVSLRPGATGIAAFAVAAIRLRYQVVMVSNTLGSGSLENLQPFTKMPLTRVSQPSLWQDLMLICT